MKKRYAANYRIGRNVGLSVIAGLLTLASCATSECYDNRNSLPRAGFYSSDSIPQAVSLDSVSIYGIGAPGDSVLHDSVRNLTETYLPFRIDQDRTQYVIKYLGGVAGFFHLGDTITFNYDIEPWFVSSACGVVYNYRIKSIETTHFAIDSVTCPLGVINNVDGENIRIYFKVGSGEGDEG